MFSYSIFAFKFNFNFAGFSSLLSLIQILVLYQRSCTGDVDILYRKDVCDEEDFYIPYVRLLRTRQPYHENSPILKLLTPGYIDVSKHTGILCINGPAIVYTDLNKDTNPKCGSSSSWIPSNGEPETFSHDCFSINRLARESYQQADQQVVTKDSRVFGNKVFGVYLVGMAPDYRIPQFVFLPRPDYGFPSSAGAPASGCIHEGASLAFVTNSSESSSHCYSIKKYNTDGVVTVGYPGSPMFCYREDREEDFDMPFHKDKDKPLSMQDVVWSENCVTAEISAVSSANEFDVEPMQLPDFRIIDPSLWSSQGSQAVVWKAKRRASDTADIPLYSKPHPPGSMFHDEPGWRDSKDLVPIKNIEATTDMPYQKFRTEISHSDCEEFATPPDTCAPDVSEPCVILNHVLTLEETDWKSAAMKDGSWRLPIFKVINNIYEKACPQVSKYLPSSLSRVFQHFLFKELEADAALQPDFNSPQNQEWTEMLGELNRCMSKAQMMNFFKKTDNSAVKLKKKLEGKLEVLQQRIANRIAATGASATAQERGGSSSSSADPFTAFSSSLAHDQEHLADLREVDRLQEHLSEVPLKFPYKIIVGTSTTDGYTGASQVFHYREAAEVDHELDWVLDTYWKVVTTVLGYCHVHYEKKEPETFTRFYERFTTDFFKFVKKAWIKGDNRQIYDHIFGDFIHGSGALWLDACQNGAYQWSEIVELRPLRPLELIEGDMPPSQISPGSQTNPSPGPANFFLDNPIYTKLNIDHYDYYDEPNKEPDTGSPELYTVAERKTGQTRILRNTDGTVQGGGINDPLFNLIK